jgi:predicted ATPase/class 3 adenylate cyclase
MNAGDRELPTGTVTFLFTDIEGSTRILQHLGPRYDEIHQHHDRLLREAAAGEGGLVVSTAGDAFFIVFQSAPRAVAAAAAAQRALAAFPWPDGGVIRVRMGLHTGEAALTGEDYVGLDVHRAARISAAGHGGQILVSQSTKSLVEGALTAGVHVRDLGEHRLKDLLRPERLFQVVVAGLAADFPTLRTLDAVPNNLPTQLTTFIGRTRELEETRRLLGGTRLLTLTGPGGGGKTRLALQLATEVIDQFQDGVYFVPLAPIFDPTLVASSIALALDVQEAGGRSVVERLLEYLGGKELLLLLDNFEQVLAAAPLVTDLLRASPRLKIVVTSRAVLHVSGEQEFLVPPLRLPDPRHLPALESLSQYEAVALFIQRALAVKPDFAVTNENAPAVAEITSRLDGLPLAIELAAARVKLLPPQALLARLERRLTVLGGGPRDLPARQQTLRDTIAWGYDLLDGPGRRLLARVSVFVGGCRLEEAEQVCEPAREGGLDVLDGLAALADQSLLRQEDVAGEPRFMMLETIREFALERLEASGEADEIRRRHAAAFLALAERAAPHLLGPHRTDWLDRLEREHDNMRAAIAWAIERGEAAVAQRLGTALWRFWQMRGHLREGSERLAAILAIEAGAGRSREYARALEAAGGIAYWRGDFAAAERFYTQHLALERERNDLHGVADALYNLSFVYVVPKTDIERGRALLDESLRLYEQANDRAGIARVTWALSTVAYTRGDYRTTLQRLETAMAIFRDLEDQFGLAWAFHDLGITLGKIGDLPAARAALEEGLASFAHARDLTGIAGFLLDLSALALLEGDPERAGRLAGGAAALQKTSGGELARLLDPTEGPWQLSDVALDRQALAAAVEEGRVMSVDALVTYALRRSVT